MTTVRSPIRSTNTITADGHADDQSTARARAVDGLELTGYDVVQTNTLSSTAAESITVRAVARSTEIQPHEASGPNYDAPWLRTCSRSPTSGSASASRSTPDVDGHRRRRSSCTSPISASVRCSSASDSQNSATGPSRRFNCLIARRRAAASSSTVSQCNASSSSVTPRIPACRAVGALSARVRR